MLSKTAIYPGTFDPVTKGHMDLITRALKLFPRIIVAVATSEIKKPYFSLEERIKLLEEALKDIEGVEVQGFNTLLIDFARKSKAEAILRGLRSGSDFEYEFQLAGMNRCLAPEIETVFLTPSQDLMFISSSLVRDIAQLKGDVSAFVPEPVVQAFKFEHK